ncbi:MAG TPA: hypothetical protein VI935_10965 [Thermodesulfobacteriota bacterium]|nr:hypothetical protein [Thermodesulfobacteriota bacterium]
MLLQFLNFTNFTGLGGLNHISYNLYQVVPVVEGFNEYGVCLDAKATIIEVDQLGFWLTDLEASRASNDDLHNCKAHDDLEAADSFFAKKFSTIQDKSLVDFKKYISGNKFGLGRSFGVSFWVWKDVGLGFVLDRGEASLQVLNQSSENFLLGPRYRF